MKVAPLLILLIALGFLAEAPAHPDSGTDARRIAFLKKLQKEGEIRSATCREFADALLLESGLPAIAHTSPIRGERGSVDRRLEESSPPVLTDEIHLSKPSVSIRIKTAANDARHLWSLTLNRSLRVAKAQESPAPKIRDVMQTETVFSFELDPSKGQYCPLTVMGFSASASKLGFQQAATYRMEDCIDLLDGDLPGKTPDGAGPIALEIARKDCRTAVRYFEQAKTLLLKAR